MVKGGFQVGEDNRVHTTWTHNPSSLRLSSHSPNMQNIPAGRENVAARLVKRCFVAAPGSVFWARDYSGIEAVLVGYLAGSQRYTRLAQLGVHAFLASHIHGEPADLSWSDDDLSSYFKDIKGRSAHIYATAKRIVHGSNYMMTPRKMSYEYPEEFPTIKRANELQGLYFDLFPEIRSWHHDLCKRVDGTKSRKAEQDTVVDPWTLGVCYAKNPFGYVHRFYNVLDWEKIEGVWYSSFGEDAKRLVSFLPQSTAAAIIKRAGRRLWVEKCDVGSSMRLWIHDEILGECREEELERCLRVSREVMESPVPELPLDPTWGMGESLVIKTEAKAGRVWGTMSDV